MATYLDGMDKHNSNNTEANVPIKKFMVSVTFDCMVAKNPLDAAKKAAKWLIENNDAENMIYDVIDETNNKKYTVDLSEDDENAVLPND